MSDNNYNDSYSSAEYKRSSHTSRSSARSSRKRASSGSDSSFTNIQDFENLYLNSSENGGTPQPQKKPKSKRNKKRKKRKIFKRIFIAILVLVIMACLAAAGGVIYVISNAEKIDPNDIYANLSENSVLYDSNGVAMENIMSSELRTNLDYSEMPKQLVNSFVAIEDKTFWKHNGFNFVRIGGAILESITSGDSISGTSTITQQLARNAFLPDKKSERTIVRKITEAYYTVLLERALTKEQIVEAYLNTIYLGFNAYGVEAAAKTYFDKSASELSLAECSALATIPKSPNQNALIKRYYSEDVDANNSNIIANQGEYTLVYNDRFKGRQKYVLQFMAEDGYISQAEADEAYAHDLKGDLKPPTSINSSTTTSSYYTDYAKSEAIDILMEELNLDQAKAEAMLYTGGLKVYSALDPSTQNIIEEAYADKANFPSPRSNRKDSSGNMLTSEGQIMLYSYDNFFESDGSFILHDDEYEYDASGNLVLFKNNRLSFQKATADGKVVNVKITFKPMYTYEGSALYIINGGTISVDAAYKSLDNDGNIVISSEFLNANPGVFAADDSGAIKVSAEHFTLNPEVIQPQSAMVIMDQYTGRIVAMVGGRNIEGSQLYNRANSPRQPGSSIKPLAVYSKALLEGMTGATVIPDSPNYYKGKLWPTNSYTGYKGDLSLRRAVQVSSNVASVRVLEYMGVGNSYNFMEELGITTLSDSDKNLAALGLGGLTNGLKPIESAAAYATIANGGTYYSPTTITKILNRNGEIIYQHEPKGETVMDEGTAFCMTDILKSVVSGGTGSRARIYSNNSTIPVAGKTGTTSSNYDAWFCGYTPYYTAVVWIGNDYNIQLSNGSGSSAQLWSKVMTQVHNGLEAKSFTQPDTVQYSGGEYSVIDRAKISGGSGKSYTICTETGLLAVAGCPSTATCRESIFTSAPKKSCTVHHNWPAATDNEGGGTDANENPDSEDPPDDTGDGGTTPANPVTPSTPGDTPSTNVVQSQ